MLGVADPDADGIMEYAKFVPWAAQYIRNNFFFKPLCEKQKLLMEGKVTQNECIHESSSQFDPIEI